MIISKAVGVELDLGAIASAAVNAAKNDLKMDTYYPQEVGGSRRTLCLFSYDIFVYRASREPC